MDYAKRSTRTTPRCLECGKSLGYGRSDRKYCSDGCRNSHHNHLARSGRNIRRRVMTILERNYQILDAVVKSGVQAVWLSDLMAAGFNPGYATSFRRSRHKEEYTCFDIRYVMTPGRLSSISKIQNLSLNLQAGPDEGHV